MSGGSWDYFYSQVQSVAERLCGESHPLRQKIGERMVGLAEVLHDIEWSDSADTGPEDWIPAAENWLGQKHPNYDKVLVQHNGEIIYEARQLHHTAVLNPRVAYLLGLHQGDTLFIDYKMYVLRTKQFVPEDEFNIQSVVLIVDGH